MRKRTQKMMQAVPIWMPMTMLPREASPSLHWHMLFSPGNKHRPDETQPEDGENQKAEHIHVVPLLTILHTADITVLRQKEIFHRVPWVYLYFAADIMYPKSNQLLLLWHFSIMMSPEEMKLFSHYFLCNVPGTSVYKSAVELKQMIGMLDIWCLTAFSINGLTFL